MDTKWSSWLGLVLGVFVAGQTVAQSGHQNRDRSFCIAPPHDTLCAVFPQDQTDFSRFFEYRVVDAAAQRPFDEYAWQAFIALNWPDVGQGAAEGWHGFARARDVMGDEAGACANNPYPPGTVVAEIKQSDGNMLVDQLGNFVVFERRLNRVAQDYILANALNTQAGQAALSGAVSFPIGVDQDRPASVLVKTAWRILPAPDPIYIQAHGVVPIPAHRSRTGTARCLPVRLGLIGMHIVSKVQSGHGDKWIWATFEHTANVPTSPDARAINSLYAKTLFPDGCQSPQHTTLTSYTLFNPDCPDCPTNVPPPPTAVWGSEAPFARTPKGDPVPPSQIVRCWKIFDPTRLTNAAWQAKLAHSAAGNYMLVSAQWRGANPDPIFEQGELPRYLSNTTMETYLQTDPTGSCLGCHSGARTSAGTPADFTFLLGN